MNCLLAVDRPPTCAGEWLMPPGPIDRINLRHPVGDATVSFSPPRGHLGGSVGLRIEPDDQLGAGYYEAFARLDQQSLGRLLHWLQTGEALERDDPRIPNVFGTQP